MENFFDKGKHTIKIGIYLNKNMISKLAIVRRGEHKHNGNAFGIKRPAT